MKRMPEFIDNRDGNTLARALRATLGTDADGDAAKDSIRPDLVRIATAFFSPAGFAEIADDLRLVSVVRLMLGADHTARTPDQRKGLGETSEAFERRRMGAGLRRMDAEFRQRRDGLPFTRASVDALRKLIGALRAGNMEVRRYEKNFLHAKAYVVTAAEMGSVRPEGVIVGSSNLTGAGLARNLELNLACHDRPVVDEAERWFDDLWNEAEPYDLAAVFEEAFWTCSPWEIFLRVLWQLYGSEIAEDSTADGDLPLTNFQKHGVARALRLIDDTGGVIVADEVGLGKTFIAGEILKRYHKRRQRALLICPAALRDSTWKNFLATHQLFVECLSFEELANDIRLRAPRSESTGQNKLLRPLEEYQLVIVDEAHNYRNPDTPTRAATLRRLLFGQRRDLVLMTATPVNNSLWDLYHLLRFFLRQDAHLAERGVLSIRARFDLAMREDPFSLNPDVLYPIIDATTVKRTRQFVKKHYAGDMIPGPDGRMQPIVFPQPRVISVRYNLDELLPSFFDRLERALDPDSEDTIAFARYMPDAWLLDEADEEETARCRSLIGLLRSGILKRFESSAFAFRNTIKKMVREHSVFLEALDAGQVVTTVFMKELSADETVFEDLLETTKHSSDATGYDVEGLRAAVERDRRILLALADETAAITRDRDPKLRVLADALVEIARQAESEATDSIDEAQKRKVLVFSFFEDSVEWVRDFLKTELATRPELAGYRGRMVAVSGSGDLDEPSRQQAAQGFAPDSMEAPAGQDADLYDILLSTDVLAEGVNLQQCRHIINFDVPWNPMRLVQRHGRIDRIGSPHSRVFVRTIFPVDRLDQLLNLEDRIRGKLAMAAASVGVIAPIEDSAHGNQVFTETREEIERLLAGDASLYERGGTVGAAQTGEEYRHTLRKALEQDRDRIRNLPWKVGSGMMKGKRRGMFFCAVVGRESDFERTFLRFVAAGDDWRPCEGDDAIEHELGTCLRLIECADETPVWYPEDLRERAHAFWSVAQDDILFDWMRETDPANLQPPVRPLNHRVAAFIRAHPPHGISEDRLNRSLDILETPWPRRDEVLLRGWFEAGKREGVALSQFLIAQILNTGFEPVVPPKPLPPIVPEDIEVLCWMGIEPSDDVSAESA